MKFSIEGDRGSATREIDLDAVLIAGYTGRDRAAVMHHIEELAAIGVPPPETVPAYWLLPPWLATNAGSTSTTGAGTSGEAELCLLVDGDDVFVTVASDHTDRQAESVDIGLSKAICQKPVASQAWPIGDIGDRWGELVLRSWIVEDGREVVYQDGPCSSLVSPPELLAGIPFERPRRFMMLTGTVPVLGGIRPSTRFRGELHDPGRNRSIGFQYDVRSLQPTGGVVNAHG
jgi:hypothetical protein